jgi:hypothetical protein
MKEQALLGLATTQELLNELTARIMMGHKEGLDYRTVEPQEVRACQCGCEVCENCTEHKHPVTLPYGTTDNPEQELKRALDPKLL